jgi:hypothetical protein
MPLTLNQPPCEGLVRVCDIHCTPFIFCGLKLTLGTSIHRHDHCVDLDMYGLCTCTASSSVDIPAPSTIHV